MARTRELMETEPDYVDVDFDQAEADEAEDREFVDETVPFDEEKDKEKINEIISWLSGEIERVESNRGEKYERLKKWRRARQGDKGVGEKNTPYPNSSNVSVPMSLIMGQSTFGVLKGTFGAKIPFWSIKSQMKDEEMHKKAAFLEKYYRIISESRFDLDLRRKNRTILYEGGTLGTCMVKVSWVVKDWFFKRIEGGVPRQVSSNIHNGPAVLPQPYEHCIYPDGQESVQDVPWFSHKNVLQKHELEARKTDGVYSNIDTVLASPRTEPTDQQRVEADIMGKDIQSLNEYDLHEIYFYYDADGDGIPEDLIFTVHLDTGTLVKQQYNNLGWRPFVPVNYFHVPYSIEGRGTCQTVEYLQEEANAVHNIRNDNMKLANMRMLAVKRTGKMNARERMYPGKIWWLENPKNDINVIQLGEVYPSSVNEENMLWRYAEQSVGMPSIKSGFSDQTLKSRDTWRGQQLRAGQSDGLFDAVKEGMEDAYKEIGILLFFSLVEHKDEVIEKEVKLQRLNEDEIRMLTEILSIKVDEIPQTLQFDINTSGLQDTYAAQQQSLMMLTQVSNMAQQQLMPLAQMLLGPQGPKMIQEAPELYQYMNDTFVNNWRTLEKIYEFAGFEDTENYIPDMEKQKQLQKLLRQMQDNMLKAQGVPQLPEGEGDVGLSGGAEPGAGGSVPNGEGGPPAAGGGAQGFGGGAGAGAAGPGGSPAFGGQQWLGISLSEDWGVYGGVR